MGFVHIIFFIMGFGTFLKVCFVVVVDIRGVSYMVKAMWHGKVIAESNATIEVEGNQYFPPDDVKKEFLQDSDTHSTCPWKGLASYYDVVVEGEINKDAAWYYPKPKDEAKKITGYVAFWKGVEVVT
jgi:uncharacterized protein (DUF427 family)